MDDESRLSLLEIFNDPLACLAAAPTPLRAGPSRCHEQPARAKRKQSSRCTGFCEAQSLRTEWPATGLLIAATNHPDLIDPALWRRFELLVEFKLPERPAIKAAIRRFLGADYAHFGRWLESRVLTLDRKSNPGKQICPKRFRRVSQTNFLIGRGELLIV